jgi:hypothetical protein
MAPFYNALVNPLRLSALSAALALASVSSNAQVTAEKLRWKGGAKAAYTYIHDDLCDPTTPGIFSHAQPEAKKRGLVFGSGAIVQECPDDWAKLKSLVADGHEILSHSWTHPDLNKGGSVQKEIIDSKAAIEKNVTNQKEVTYFIFPEDSYNDNLVAQVKAAGYLSFRGVKVSYQDRGITKDLDKFQPFGSTYFMVYQGKNFAALKTHITDAIAAGGWSNQEMHGVSDGSWETFPLADYQAHLDFVKAHVDNGDLWNATPTAVVRYIVTYNGAGAPSVSGNTLSFPSANIAERYDTPISVALTVPGATAVTAKQGGVDLPVKKNAAGKFIVEVNPKLGPVSLTHDGSLALAPPAAGNRLAPRAASAEPLRDMAGRRQKRAHGAGVYFPEAAPFKKL